MEQQDGFHWNEDQLGDLIHSIPLFSVPPARSRSISAVGYDEDARIFVLQLRARPGGDERPLTYAYLNFPPQELEALLTSASMGQHVNTVVAPRYDCVAVQERTASA